MASANHGTFRRGVERLFTQGSLTGIGEGQLLRQYAIGGDEAAFEALVTRHGPMVLSVCRRMLYDPRDVEDAFQATFLVLLRRAGSLGVGAPRSPRPEPSLLAELQIPTPRVSHEVAPRTLADAVSRKQRGRAGRPGARP